MPELSDLPKSIQDKISDALQTYASATGLSRVPAAAANIGKLFAPLLFDHPQYPSGRPDIAEIQSLPLQLPQLQPLIALLDTLRALTLEANERLPTDLRLAHYLKSLELYQLLLSEVLSSKRKSSSSSWVKPKVDQPSIGRLAPPGLDIAALLDRELDTILDRLYIFSRRLDFTRYVPSLIDAWHLSVIGLNQSIRLAEQHFHSLPELTPNDDYRDDPISAFVILESQLLRARGVPLSMFLGLYHYYREVYLSVIYDHFENEELAYARDFLNLVFMRIQIAISCTWIGLTEAQKIAELQASNLSIARDKYTYLAVFESLPAPAFILDSSEGIVRNLNFAALRLLSPNSSRYPGATYYRDQMKDALAMERSDSPSFTGRPIATLLPWISNLSTITREIPLDKHEVAHLGWHRLNDTTYEVTYTPMLGVNEETEGIVLQLYDVTERARLHSELVRERESLSRRVEERTKELKETLASLAVTNLELVKTSRHKSEFLSHMSHELRTPLNSILGFTELLSQPFFGSLNEKQRRYVQLIQDNGKNLLDLIQDLLDLSRLDAGHMKLSAEILTPSLLVHEAAALMQPLFQAAGLSLSFDLDPKLPEIYSDPRLIRQILINLISNAIKYTPKGGHVTLSTRHSDKDWIQIAVTDTGCGVAPEDAEFIFQDFSRGRSKGIESIKGTGIGLALSRRIASFLGGAITLQSELNKGSTFTLCLPANRESRVIEPSSDSAKFGARVVVASTSSERRQGLVRSLDALGVMALEASSLGQAYALAVSARPPIVFVEDQLLTSPRARDLISRLRSEPGLSKTHLVALHDACLDGPLPVDHLRTLGFERTLQIDCDETALNKLLADLETKILSQIKQSS